MTPARHHSLAFMAFIAGGALLAGCSGKAQTRPNPPPASVSASAQGNRGDLTGAANGATKPRTGTLNGAPLPASTGIPACDNYLASFVSCHAAAGIYPAGQLQARYQDMRTSLLQSSMDPATRPYLSARCAGLASQQRVALQGRSCAATAPASGSR